MRTSISEEEITARQTRDGGWTKAQLAKWGVPWPPPRGWKEDILRNGVPYMMVIQVFGGGTILAKDRPLFCRHCDGELVPEYERLWDAQAPMNDLVAVLEKRHSKIIHATWLNGRQQWQCGYCGRAAK